MVLTGVPQGIRNPSVKHLACMSSVFCAKGQGDLPVQKTGNYFRRKDLELEHTHKWDNHLLDDTTLVMLIKWRSCCSKLRLGIVQQ